LGQDAKVYKNPSISCFGGKGKGERGKGDLGLMHWINQGESKENRL
jgi:hypothetical protein